MGVPMVERSKSLDFESELEIAQEKESKVVSHGREWTTWQKHNKCSFTLRRRSEIYNYVKPKRERAAERMALPFPPDVLDLCPLIRPFPMTYFAPRDNPEDGISI
ncbi:hypothetical protein J6590_057384 [Homalodisca vitripennis]|nr:hypothetical protein J6590_057384 [Homalodisca vitripennis]